MSGIKCTPRPDGNKREVCKHDRYCCSCGKKLNRYNRPYAKKPLCYACEDKLPWSMETLGCSNTHSRGGQ